MRAVLCQHPQSLETLKLVDMADPPKPKAGEITVRLRATSLNYHDYLVVTGKIPALDGRVPMSDGAGEVVSLGEGVSEFAVGDLVVSVFFLSGHTKKLVRLPFPRSPVTALTAMRESW